MDSGTPVETFRDGHEHLAAALQWLNRLLVREVARFRATHASVAEGFQGLFIGDADVDRLLAHALAGSAAAPDRSGQQLLLDQLTAEADRLREQLAARAAATRAQGRALPLERLAGLFDLAALDRAALLVACAPDLDSRYETLYAYLQDDVTRRRPTIGLVLALLGSTRDEQWALRRCFSADGPLLKHGLLRVSDDLPFLSRALRAEDRVLDALLDTPGALEPRLRDWATVVQPGVGWEQVRVAEPLGAQLEGLLALWRQGEEPPACRSRSWHPVAVFEGPYGTPKDLAAAALATALGRGVLALSLQQLLADQGPLADLALALRREALLRAPLLVVRDGELLGGEEPRTVAARLALGALLREPPAPVVLACAAPLEVGRLFPGLRLLRFRFPLPGYQQRRALWREALDAWGVRAEADVDQVANKFVLSPGQIVDAAAAAADLARLRRAEGSVSTADLHAAARAQSHHGLAALARKIEPLYTWDDIVLPGATRRQLGEIAAAVQHRHLVFAEWGFGARSARGNGLNALFSGPSGTGKTMAAEVLARELGLDLYRIDLATVVSKYIGETEKNLRRIFEEAQSSNAILFFDEADALFGKRSEVKDAHDRYANIEIAYLLQLMEDYEGMAILATNLSRNVDDAFARRMQYVVEFPFPDEGLRAGIWRRSFPSRTPLAEGVDIAFLARQFELAGGSIKGAALGAAVLAAADGGVIDMRHLALAIAREYQKLGKLASQGEFGPYYGAVLEHLSSVR